MCSVLYVTTSWEICDSLITCRETGELPDCTQSHVASLWPVHEQSYSIYISFRQLYDLGMMDNALVQRKLKSCINQVQPGKLSTLITMLYIVTHIVHAEVSAQRNQY